MFKKYACCGSTHAPIDAALALRQRHALSVSDIEEIRIALNPRRRPHVDRPVVEDELAAKFSVQYTVAAAMADGEVKLRHFTDDSIRRPDLQNLMRRVVLVSLDGADAQLSQGCEVTVTMSRGEAVSIRLEDAEGRGSDAYAGYMARKFTDCVEHQFDVAEAGDLFRALLSFDSFADIDPLVSRLASRQAARSPEAVQ